MQRRLLRRTENAGAAQRLAIAVMALAVLFGLAELAGSLDARWSLPLPPGAQSPRLVSIAGFLLAAGAIHAAGAAAIARARAFAALLGALALAGLLLPAAGVALQPGGGMSPVVALGLLVVALAVALYRPDDPLRLALPAAASLACLTVSAGVLAHFVQWLADHDERLYLLTVSPAAAALLGLTALALGALSLAGGGARLWRRHAMLLGWSVAFAVALTGAWSLVVWVNAEHTRTELERRVEGFAQVLLEHATRSFDPAELVLAPVVEQVAARGLVEGIASVDAGTLDAKIAPLSQIGAVAVFDADGRLRQSTRAFAAAVAVRIRQDVFDAHRAGAERVIGPMRPLGDGRFAFTYSRRLHDASDRFAGFVVAAMRTEYFVDFYRSVALGPDSSVGLFRRDGWLLARDPLPVDPLRVDLERDRLFAQLLRARSAGTFVAASPFDGRQRLVAYRALAAPPLAVVAALSVVPLAEAFQRAFLALAGLLSLVLMLLAVAVTAQLQTAERERAARRHLRRAHGELSASAEHLQEIAATVPGVIYQWSRRPDGRRSFPYVSPRARDMLGLEPAHFDAWTSRIEPRDLPPLLDAMRSAVAAVQPWDFEARLRVDGGRERWLRLLARPTRRPDGEIVYTGVIFDITEERLAKAELERLATTDSLTGLANRRQFEALCAREIARQARFPQPLTLLMLDVDHFKRVNDSHGHAAGDAVLVAVAQALRQALRDVDVVGRLGGEEFAALLVGADETAASEVAERLRAACREDVRLPQGGPALRVTISLGLSAWRDGEATMEAALRRADAALYEAKRLGRDRWVVHGLPGRS